MLKYFYTKRSAISLAFKRYQYLSYNQSAFTSSFHFSDATPTWIWAEFTKSGQSWYFALVTLCKKFRQTADWHPFLWSEFLICHIFKWSEEVLKFSLKEAHKIFFVIKVTYWSVQDFNYLPKCLLAFKRSFHR